MKLKIAVLILNLIFTIGFSAFYYNQYTQPKPSYNKLKEKCEVLENTVELALAIIKENEKKHKEEIKLYRKKIDGMYNKLILGEE